MRKSNGRLEITVGRVVRPKKLVMPGLVGLLHVVEVKGDYVICRKEDCHLVKKPISKSDLIVMS